MLFSLSPSLSLSFKTSFRDFHVENALIVSRLVKARQVSNDGAIWALYIHEAIQFIRMTRMTVFNRQISTPIQLYFNVDEVKKS